MFAAQPYGSGSPALVSEAPKKRKSWVRLLMRLQSKVHSTHYVQRSRVINFHVKYNTIQYSTVHEKCKVLLAVSLMRCSRGYARCANAAPIASIKPNHVEMALDGTM